jgi:hypothetical protein
MTRNPMAKGAPLRRSDTLPAGDLTWRLPKPTAGGIPVPARNEPILYIQIPRRPSDGEMSVEEE